MKDVIDDTFEQKEVDDLLNDIHDITFHEYNHNKSIIYLKTQTAPIYISTLPETKRNMLMKIFKIVKEAEKKNNNKSEFQIIFYNHYIRIGTLFSIAGMVYSCRHMPKDFILLSDAGFPDYILNELTHERLNKGGLVFISGAPGQGKSNTAAGLIDARLKKYGGVFIAIEDPVEIPLHGEHGKGQCIQVPVEDSFESCIKRSLRSYPTGQNCGLFVGELRDYQSALAAIQGAIDGRLIVTTFHTKSLELAFERLYTLISQKVSKEEAANLLAESFKLGIHQRIVKVRHKDIEDKYELKLRSQVLVDTTEVYNFIKQEKISGILDQLEKQYSLFTRNGKIQYR